MIPITDLAETLTKLTISHNGASTGALFSATVQPDGPDDVRVVLSSGRRHWTWKVPAVPHIDPQQAEEIIESVRRAVEANAEPQPRRQAP